MDLSANKKFNIIYADPPWQYDEDWGNGAVHHHYKTLSIEELARIPVQEIADENCHLYLWFTNSFVREAHRLCDLWGFSYKQTITWVKTYADGKPVMGTGYYFRGCTEHILFATKGALPRVNKAVKNFMIFPKSKHSKKPNIFRQMIIKQSGDLPRIELFARTKIHGWETWGNDDMLNIKPLENYAVL